VPASSLSNYHQHHHSLSSSSSSSSSAVGASSFDGLHGGEMGGGGDINPPVFLSCLPAEGIKVPSSLLEMDDSPLEAAEVHMQHMMDAQKQMILAEEQLSNSSSLNLNSNSTAHKQLSIIVPEATGEENFKGEEGQNDEGFSPTNLLIEKRGGVSSTSFKPINNANSQKKALNKKSDPASKKKPSIRKAVNLSGIGYFLFFIKM
jgi:hypothetical protein